jgi:hypothetical protein
VKPLNGGIANKKTPEKSFWRQRRIGARYFRAFCAERFSQSRCVVVLPVDRLKLAVKANRQPIRTGLLLEGPTNRDVNV